LFFHFSSFSQSANVIIEINGKIIISEFYNVYLKFDVEGNTKKINIEYLPGDLRVPEEAWSIIKNQSEKKFILHVDYNTYEKGKQEVANFDIELSKYLIEQKYLIADIYDFRDKSYRRRYQYITDKNYLVQFYYQPENGVNGIYISRK
jgi:hypothetical protein